jgi:exodeoxyribonuclease VIII
MDEFTRSVAVQDAIRHDPIASRFFVGAAGACEVALLWTDSETGIDCKALLDVSHEYIVDVKTAKDASPEGFGRAAYNYSYDMQSAMYTDAVRSVTGRELPYVLVVAESAPPYAVSVFFVPSWIVERGRRDYRALLAQVAACRASGAYPGYSLEPMELQLPRWAAINENTEATEEVPAPAWAVNE